MAVFRSLLQHVALLTDIDGGGSYDLLADRIDRRIGYLGKELLEVVKQRLMLLGKHSQRTVCTHGRNGLCTI